MKQSNIEITDLVWNATRKGYDYQPRKQHRCRSPLEVMLWNEIYCIPGIVSDYAVQGTRYRFDFACPERKIGIEVDGHQWHSSRKQRRHDAQRDRKLQSLGWQVLRFTGDEVRNNLSACVQEIRARVTC